MAGHHPLDCQCGESYIPFWMPCTALSTSFLQSQGDGSVCQYSLKYVKPPVTLSGSDNEQDLSGCGGRRCRVLYSYSPQNDDELQLQVNDEIDFLSEVEDGWWKGKLGNKIGVFPSNFVCELTNDESCPSEGDVSAPLSSPDSGTAVDDAPVLPPKPIKETCRVLFAYDAVNDDELTLKKDDVITIITKEVGDKGWWKGELRGKIGLFPDNFVELIFPPEEILLTQKKKPDRPSKTFEKIDSKIPLISSQGFQKILQESPEARKEQDEKKNNSNGSTNSPNSVKKKTDGKFADKNSNSFQIKTDPSVAGHRKPGAEVKSLVTKKPVLPPPPTNKPKPVSGKPSNVKRLSEEISDLFENSGNKTPGSLLKRLSGDVHDLIDGAVGSKIGCLGQSPGGGFKEDFDLDIVERSDMLTHITSSRPRPPGRRLPTKETKESDGNGPVTNGSTETGEKEKKEREWEKNKPPWVNELKLNLRSSKTPPGDKKTPGPGQVKSPVQSPSDTPSSGITHESTTGNVTVKQFSPQPQVSIRCQGPFETGSKVFELSSKFSSVEKTKPMTSVSASKSADTSWTSGAADQSGDDFVQIPRKEYSELKSRVDKLEKLVVELAGQLSEEVEKRKLIEKELSKLTDLVTQV
ncbi:hypothetical protein RUM43_001389 [Polyplax serrata]|uniref:SH3 domain-containing protein n=1 Tax=Polyplax serrata TaxID=468196 RepID=A0AAN8XPN6_POLSC